MKTNLKLKTNVKAGGIRINHNQKLKARTLRIDTKKPLSVKTDTKAGAPKFGPKY
jgi:hypothetical protein